MTIGLCDVRVYLPSSRLTRACIAKAHDWATSSSRVPSGTIACANWDEDSLTMAQSAARELNNHDAIQSLRYCSTTAPFADRSNAALLAESLSLAAATATQDHGGSQRAASSALLAELSGARSGALVVAGEKRLAKPASPQELLQGDAAVAVLTGDDNLVAEFLGGVSRTTDFVDHYRQSGSDFDYDFEARWIRDEGLGAVIPDAIGELLTAKNVSPDAVKRLVLNAPAFVRKKVAGLAGLSAASIDSALDDAVGDTGCVSALLGLAEALENANSGDLVLLATFGQGVDVQLFRVIRPLDATLAPAIDRGREDDNYLRFLSHRGLVELDWGKRAERDVRTSQSAYYRARDQISAFVGGQCTSCDTVQFPRSQACVNPECRQFGEQRPYSLANAQGRVKSFTEDWQAYSPDPPLIYGNIDFPGNANVLMQFSDARSGDVEVGTRIRPQFRIKDIDRARGFRRYFWKAVVDQDAS